MHRNHATLRRRILHVFGVVPAESGAAGDMDERSTADFAEMRDRLAAQMPGSNEIDLKGAVPDVLPLGELILDARGFIDTGVVDQYVDAPFPGKGVGPKPPNLIVVHKIGAQHLAAIAADFGSHRFSHLGIACEMQNNMGARLRHSPHNSRPDSPRPTRDKHDLAGQINHFRFPFSAYLARANFWRSHHIVESIRCPLPRNHQIFDNHFSGNFELHKFFRVLILAALIAPAEFATAKDADEVFHHSRTVVLGNISAKPVGEMNAALSWLEKRGQPDIAPTLILALRYNRQLSDQISGALSKITGNTEAKNWFDWMLWLEGNGEIVPHPSYQQIKLDMLMAVDPKFARFLPLSRNARIRREEVVWGGVAVDGIPALTNPLQTSADEADFLIPGELVFGVEINGDARAYPLRILDWHEMLNDVIGGVPVSLAYCTLCGSGILFETRLAGFDDPLVFGSSGLLYRSNKLMFDRATDSLWNQFTGRPISGALVGQNIELKILPVTITSWREWRTRHPDTQVLSLDTGHVRDYTPGAPYSHYFNSPDLMFPARADEKTRPIKDYVFGIRTAGGAKAWPVEDFRSHPVINDAVGLANVVLIGNAATRTVRAYLRGDMTFEQNSSRDQLIANGESWNVTEDSLVGPGGKKLPRVAGHVAFWFAWSAFVGRAAEITNSPKP